MQHIHIKAIICILFFFIGKFALGNDSYSLKQTDISNIFFSDENEYALIVFSKMKIHNMKLVCDYNMIVNSSLVLEKDNRYSAFFQNLERKYPKYSLNGIFNISVTTSNNQFDFSLKGIMENGDDFVLGVKDVFDNPNFCYIMELQNEANDITPPKPPTLNTLKTPRVKKDTTFVKKNLQQNELKIKVYLDRGVQNTNDTVFISNLLTRLVNDLDESRSGRINLENYKNSFTTSAFASLQFLVKDEKICTNYKQDQHLQLIHQGNKKLTRGLKVKSLTDSDEHILRIFFDQNKITQISYTNENIPPEKWIIMSGRIDNYEAYTKIMNFYFAYKNSFVKNNLHKIDFEFLNSIFRDDTLIIIGRKIYKVINKNELLNNDSKYVYQQRKFNNYLSALYGVNNNNEWIEVELEIIDVRKSLNSDDIWGLTLKQKWSSSSYNDDGYLFLLFRIEQDEVYLIARCWDEVNSFSPDKYRIVNN